MPNLRPPVTTTDAAARLPRAHPRRAARRFALRAADDALPHRQHAPRGDRAREGLRLRPRGQVLPRGRDDATPTPGVTALERVYPALAAMEEQGVVLSLHGEVTDADVDIFDRERVFVERSLDGDRARFSRAARSCSSTSPRAEAAAFVARRAGPTSPRRSRRSISLYSRNALFAGGVRPHLYCLPILKRERHREALRRGGDQRQPEILSRHRFGAARARTRRKTRAAAPAAIPRRSRSRCTPKRSSRRGALDRLEGFASHFGADFYGLPRHGDKVTLEREPWTVPGRISVRRASGRAAARGRDGGLARRVAAA